MMENGDKITLDKNDDKLTGGNRPMDEEGGTTGGVIPLGEVPTRYAMAHATREPKKRANFIILLNLNPLCVSKVEASVQQFFGGIRDSPLFSSLSIDVSSIQFALK
jgi:hypothetical protein